MLKPLASPDARCLREFFKEANYTHEHFRQNPELRELPSRRRGGYPPNLFENVQSLSRLELLLRWFFQGASVEERDVADRVPGTALVLMLEAGMLVREGTLLRPTVMLTPCDEFLFAADTAARMESAQSADVVLWPNPTTRLLHQFTIRESVEETLDLGAGCGVQAVLASRHSRRVTATDLNPRAAEFTVFNAAFNGVDNVVFCVGDTFEPVAGQTFDLIVANPPFFVTPSSTQLYCENSMELDLYCRRVTREAPGHLKPGGFLQMVFEWVEVRGQAWQDRLKEWFEGSGCDVWMFHNYARDAVDYARERVSQTHTATAEPEAEILARWTDYYRQRGVERIHGGILAMRRRQGRNWVYMEDMPLAPREPFGGSMAEAFRACDFLESHGTEEAMLGARPRLSAHAQLEQQFQQADGKWRPVVTKLLLAGGIPASMRVEPPVAEFLARLDGRQTLGELADDLARRAQADSQRVRQECMTIVSKLIGRRFIVSP